MYIKKGTTTVDLYITVRNSEFSPGDDELLLGMIDREPSKSLGCLKLTVDLPDGFWAAFEPPIIEAGVTVSGLTRVVSETVIEEVEL